MRHSLRISVHVYAQAFMAYIVVTTTYVLQHIYTGSKSNNFVFITCL